MAAPTTPRWFASVAVLCLVAASAPAQPAAPAAINGVYNGTVADAQGTKTVKLTLRIAANGALTGEFTFYPTSASPDPTCSFGVGGSFDAATGRVNLRPLRWLTPPPAGFRMIGIAGTFEAASGRISGAVTGGRNTIEVTRNPAESANAGGSVSPPTSTAVARTSPQPVASPANAPSPLTAINGVYTGTYICVDGSVKLKFSIKSTDDGSLSGLFTFDLPAWAGAHPVTYKLTGRYLAGNRLPFQFPTVEPVGAPAPPAYAMTAVNATFGVGPYVMGSDGQLHDGFNFDHLHGSTPGKGSSNFTAMRDKAESADLDRAMAAQASAASTPTATAPAAPMARLHSIDGVYNGTFAGQQGPITFQLTIRQTGGGKLAAVATVNLPADAGTKAVTYNLEGVNEPENNHHFALHARQGETVPPGDTAPVEFGGRLILDVAHNAARFVGTTRTGIRIEATWDATATAASDAARAAQEKVDTAAHRIAMDAFYEVRKNAQPKEFASKDLVRKSKAYWDNYDTDMIREVFDGGFGADIVDNKQFQRVFCTYVEMFSATHADCLPANHQRLVITWRTNRKFDQYNNLISEDNHDYTVDMDSRFVEKYQYCSASLTAKGAEIRGILLAMQPGGAQRMLFDMMALAKDTQRFLADQGGKSAATRQMNENFLRAINGQLSLQQAGGKIDGAQAESDRDLPPGRYARFVDGANAFYRDPANARYRGRNDTEFVQALAVRLEFKLSPDEEYYYANDFKTRFYDQIIQPQKPSSDPNWSLFHPVVEECMAAIH